MGVSQVDIVIAYLMCNFTDQGSALSTDRLGGSDGQRRQSTISATRLDSRNKSLLYHQ